MEKVRKDPLFKKGVWIKEQQGILTIGSLDENDKTVMVIPDDLSAKIQAFEDDMIEALYGEDKVSFDSAVINVDKLLINIKKRFKGNDLRISFSETKDTVFKGDYTQIFNLIEKFVLSSLSGPFKDEKVPLIYINASIISGHLCIIYRDSGSISTPLKLKNEIDFIKTGLKGEISYKSTPGDKSYYDIMIPSNG